MVLVTDVSGEPIIGANIRIKGTTTGTITDIDGNFSCASPSQGRLTSFPFFIMIFVVIVVVIVAALVVLRDFI